MADNQTKFNESTDSVLPGKEGVRHEGALYKQARWANEGANKAARDAAILLDRFGAGNPGVRFDGDLYGMLRRIEANTGVIQNLVKALANVSGGEPLDQAKLLAGIDKTVRDAMADTVKVEVSVEDAK